ncbi:MAG: hypothetical protein EXX96DRAFT_378442 [Benjaminiella poitrasii]|nr:MAG: hypothetical protein EXX96DRAFT_378442 [Benjaminiella poitrasii]
MPSNNNDEFNISQCSVSGLFQELFDKGFKLMTATDDSAQYNTDEEGNDYRRLLQKHKKPVSNICSESSYNAKPVMRNAHKRKREFHQGSPDFKPIVYLERTSKNEQRRMGFGSVLYNYLFQHEDRYFNNDREELSKDIFPAGYQQSQTY